MLSNMKWKFCIFARTVNCSGIVRASFVTSSCMMEKNSFKQKEGNSSHPEAACVERNENVIMDPAVLYVGSIPVLSYTNNDAILHYQKENFNRNSVPFSSKLLEKSYSVTVSQKRKTRLSGDSCRKLARTNHDEDFEENEDPDSQLDPEYAIKRHWELTNLGVRQIQQPGNGFEFFVMSYNVLAQNLLEDNMYLYQESTEESLDWNNRSEKLLLEIKALKADILCLQEVNQSHYNEFFEPELNKLGYRGMYVKRTGDKRDGCATFYHTDKFTLVESVSVPYYKSNCSLLDRDNVGLVLKLRPHKQPCSEEDFICIANTHLLFNPRRGDIKLAQVMCLLAEINKVAKTSGNGLCQVMVCGDFNATPFSDLYKLLVQGYLRYEGLLTRTISGQKEGRYGRDRFLEKHFFPSKHNISDQCEYINSKDRECLQRQDEDGLGHHSSHIMSQSSGCLWHRLNLVSTHRHTIERLGHRDREVTTQHSADNCTVDYIFYNVMNRSVHTRRNKHTTSNITEGKLKLLARWGLMSSKEIRELGNLPNHHHPSDHLPLLVKMLLV